MNCNSLGNSGYLHNPLSGTILWSIYNQFFYLLGDTTIIIDATVIIAITVPHLVAGNEQQTRSPPY